MDFFVWQGARKPHSWLCNDEQRSQAEKDAIYTRRFSWADYSAGLKFRAMHEGPASARNGRVEHHR